MVNAMDLEHLFGETGQDMMGSGSMIKLVVMERADMQMEIFTRVIGRTIRLMVKESISVQMEADTRVIGKMTSKMVRAKRHGKMELLMKEIS
jgi:hypothetical protein